MDIEGVIETLNRFKFGQIDNWQQHQEQYELIEGGSHLEHEFSIYAASFIAELLVQLEQAREALTLAQKYGNFDPLSDQTIIQAITAALNTDEQIEAP